MSAFYKLRNMFLNENRKLILVFSGLLLIFLYFGFKYTPPGLLGKADAIGYAVCHRIDERSFHIGERQMPLCARCTGQYLGVVLGLIYQWVIGKHKGKMPSRPIIIIMIFLIAAYFVDGFNSYLHLFPIEPKILLYSPNNIFRIITGSGLGFSISLVLYPIYNQTIWREWLKEPIFGNAKHLLILFGSVILVDYLVIIENPILEYLLALASVMGVILMLSMAYSLMWIILLGLENKYWNSRHLCPVILLGMISALSQIAIIDIVRFQLTMTWAGIVIN